jgi:hypothetical protein
MEVLIFEATVLRKTEVGFTKTTSCAGLPKL